MPYRCGAFGIDDYLRIKRIKADVKSPTKKGDYVLILELLINLLYWAPEQNDLDDTNTDFDFGDRNEVKIESERLIRNIENILEQSCDMRVRKEDVKPFPKYYVTRRSAAVDAAIMAAPKLSDVLLGYYDVRNTNNLEAKMAALIAIHNYLEPNRQVYKKTSYGLISEEFFAAMNNFEIRHNKRDQLRLPSRKKKAMCDKLFAMAIYILQSVDVYQYAREVKELINPSENA